MSDISSHHINFANMHNSHTTLKYNLYAENKKYWKKKLIFNEYSELCCQNIGMS